MPVVLWVGHLQAVIKAERGTKAATVDVPSETVPPAWTVSTRGRDAPSSPHKAIGTAGSHAPNVVSIMSVQNLPPQKSSCSCHFTPVQFAGIHF